MLDWRILYLPRLAWVTSGAGTGPAGRHRDYCTTYNSSLHYTLLYFAVIYGHFVPFLDVPTSRSRSGQLGAAYFILRLPLDLNQSAAHTLREQLDQ